MTLNPHLTPLEFLDALQREENARAYRWWSRARLWQVFVLAIGIITTAFNSLRSELFFLALVGTLAYVLSQWYSEHLKERAQSIKRKHEFFDGAGWVVKIGRASCRERG